MIAPSVQQLAREYEGRATIAKLNADDYPEILGRYGIMGIPTTDLLQGRGERSTGSWVSPAIVL